MLLFVCCGLAALASCRMLANPYETRDESYAYPMSPKDLDENLFLVSMGKKVEVPLSTPPPVIIYCLLACKPSLNELLAQVCQPPLVADRAIVEAGTCTVLVDETFSNEDLLDVGDVRGINLTHMADF